MGGEDRGDFGGGSRVTPEMVGEMRAGGVGQGWVEGGRAGVTKAAVGVVVPGCFAGGCEG